MAGPMKDIEAQLFPRDVDRMIEPYNFHRKHMLCGGPSHQCALCGGRLSKPST